MIAAAAAAHTTRRQPECRNSHISGWSPPRLHSKFCFERRKEAGRRRGSRPLQGRQKKPDKSGEASANTPKNEGACYNFLDRALIFRSECHCYLSHLRQFRSLAAARIAIGAGLRVVGSHQRQFGSLAAARLRVVGSRGRERQKLGNQYRCEQC